MKNIWLYYRLSRDEDKELNSLTNQRNLLADYAQKNKYTIVGESFDDNVSGMTFEREGLAKLSEAVDKNLIDGVLVKDLSRLGRHKTQTDLYIEYLRSKNVNVHSVTENINTLDENDDLIIGFKGLINDSYAKDISKKIRHGFKQKQKTGIVLIPPFGYFKDKNTNKIVIIDECAEIVRLIYKLYIDGMGYKKIAMYLTENGYRTPSYYQKKLIGKSNPMNRTAMADKWIWIDRSVSRILTDESYIGTLYCGKTNTNKIYHTKTYSKKENQIKHENFFPPIISRETFEMAQEIRNSRSNYKERASTNNKIHKYAGLIICSECNSTFTAKTRNDWIEYVCNNYHRRGAKYCSPHRVREETLDKILNGYVTSLANKSREDLELIDKKNEMILNLDNSTDIKNIEIEIENIKEENKGLIRNMVKYPEREETYNEIISENENTIKELERKLSIAKNENQLDKIAKNTVKKAYDVLLEIGNNLTYKNIRTLVSKIYISENENKEQSIRFEMKSTFEYVADLHEYFYTEQSLLCGSVSSVILKFPDLLKKETCVVENNNLLCGGGGMADTLL